MTASLADVWLPEVEAEYFALLKLSRDVGVDVGNQFRAFERLLEIGLDAAWRPIDSAGSADIYVMYGGSVLMFFAICGSQLAIVKWTTLGTPYEQTLAREEARQRAAALFP
jgi:hypothetical protein